MIFIIFDHFQRKEAMSSLTSLPNQSPIQTPELAVGDVYPEDFDWEAHNWWQLHKRSLKRKAEKTNNHAARVLKFGSSSRANQAWMKKMKQTMKWHPADKAREAERAIQNIDPGLGYKIQIVVDDSATPPPMPRTPQLSPLKSLNSVLMASARRKSLEKKPKASSKDQSLVEASEGSAVDENKKKAPIEQQPSATKGSGVRVVLESPI